MLGRNSGTERSLGIQRGTSLRLVPYALTKIRFFSFFPDLFIVFDNTPSDILNTFLGSNIDQFLSALDIFCAWQCSTPQRRRIADLCAVIYRTAHR